MNRELNVNSENPTSDVRPPASEKSPLVSVVIPTYNRAHLICDALDSVKAQTWRPIEIIVVDDGSEDETEAVVDRWVSEVRGRKSEVRGLETGGDGAQNALECGGSDTALESEAGINLEPNLLKPKPDEVRDDFVVCYVKQPNLGGNPARNNGIRNATGEYIAFLDSDDVWHAEKLEKQMAVFRRSEVGDQRSEVGPVKDAFTDQGGPRSVGSGQHQEPGTKNQALSTGSAIGAVYCGLQHWYVDEGRVEPPAPRDYPAGNILNQMLVHDVTSPTSCYLVRKSVFEEVGVFDEELQARQDWDMWIRVAARYAIGVVPEVLVDFREHSGVRTASNPQKEINAYKAIMEKYADLRAACCFKVRRAAKASFYRRMGRVHFHQRISVPKAFGYQLLAILSWPFGFDSYAALFGMLLPRDGRQALHRAWNRMFGSTPLAIRSH